VAAFHLQREAEADLVEIGRYTEERWGREQRVRYLTALDQRFFAVADNPALGKACDELYPGLRRIPEGSHVVYFREVGGEVEIVRVLHERMLPERHLRF